MRLCQADGADAVHGAVLRGDDRRTPAAALPPAADDRGKRPAACSRPGAISTSECPDPAQREGVRAVLPPLGGAVFPAPHSPAGARSTSTWSTSCSWSCWPWPGCLCARGGLRHERDRWYSGASSSPRSSGVPGLLLSRHSMTGQWVTTVLAVLGSRSWAGGRRHVLGRRATASRSCWPWSPFPGAAEFSVAVDGLSAIFLLPIFLISLLGNVYGLGYWKQTEHPRERPQAASVLRHADRRHGPAGDRPQQHPVPVRLGDHGAVGLLPGDDRRPRPGGPRDRLDLPGGDARGDLVPVRPLRLAACGQAARSRCAPGSRTA